MAPKRPSVSLLSLPDELLIRFCRLLPSKDLHSVLLVCHILNSVAEALLYTSITISHYCTPAMLSTSLKSSDARRLSIRHFELDASEAGNARPFAPIIETLLNLERLVLFGPDWKFDETETEDTKTDGGFARLFLANSILLPGDRRILQKLTSCTLGFGDGNCDIERLPWEEVCLSASIKRLTLLDCYLSDNDGMVCCEYKFSTPLEELVLENCNINVRALTRILGVPRALRKLKLEQSPWRRNIHHWENSVPQSDQEWMDAFRQQKHSLETFRFIDQTWHLGRETSGWCKEYFDGFDVLEPPYPWDTCHEEEFDVFHDDT